jgi:hyperosmotically inducible periplasmic protein
MRYENSWAKWAVTAALALGMLGIGVPPALASAQSAAVVPAQNSQNNSSEARISKRVRHALLTMPWYGIYANGVFDNLEYSVNGTQVTLMGQVVNPATKSDAVGVVKHVEGVTSVVDRITVLPPSPMDFRIRRAEYRAIFSYSDLYRYAMGTNPSIHIIVDNGHVTLLGYVNDQNDAKMAVMRANMVPGVFSVTNDLKVG